VDPSGLHRGSEDVTADSDSRILAVDKEALGDDKKMLIIDRTFRIRAKTRSLSGCWQQKPVKPDSGWRCRQLGGNPET
jgi:hypothetical protein